MRTINRVTGLAAMVTLLSLNSVLMAQMPGHHGQHGPPPFMEQLTEEQRVEVQSLLAEMREEGATRKEIHTAVSELLESWGIEIPERNGGKHGTREGMRRVMEQLTEEQRDEVHALVLSMQENGSTRKEIREAVADLLRGWGFELPDRDRGERGRRHGSKRRIQGRNYPNPFNPETRIVYTLDTPELVQIQIYNVTGQLKRTYDMGYQSQGSHTIVWDGLTEQGSSLPSGVYLYRIQAGDEVFTERMLLLR